MRAAEAVFGEYSFERASISEITRRAGVAQGTFYNYFPDKKAAFVELVHELNTRMRAAIRLAIAEVDDRLEMERVGFQTFFDFLGEHRSLYRIVREAEFVDPETHRWHYSTLARGYVRGLEEAQAQRQITSEISADTLAWILMGIAELVGGRLIVWENRTPDAGVYDELLTFMRRGMGVRPGEGKT